MKKIKFNLNVGGYEHECIIEYDDDASEEEIETDFRDWQSNYLDSGWEEIEE